MSNCCDFCKTKLYIKVVQHTLPLLAPTTREEELRQELLNMTGEAYVLIEAKFCPICGAAIPEEMTQDEHKIVRNRR